MHQLSKILAHTALYESTRGQCGDYFPIRRMLKNTSKIENINEPKQSIISDDCGIGSGPVIIHSEKTRSTLPPFYHGASMRIVL